MDKLTHTLNWFLLPPPKQIVESFGHGCGADCFTHPLPKVLLQICEAWHDWSNQLGLKENPCKEVFFYRKGRGRRKLSEVGFSPSSNSLHPIRFWGMNLILASAAVLQFGRNPDSKKLVFWLREPDGCQFLGLKERFSLPPKPWPKQRGDGVSDFPLYKSAIKFGRRFAVLSRKLIPDVLTYVKSSEVTVAIFDVR